MAKWTAGIGRRCITPTPPTPWLAGYGHRDTRATGKLHDIHVKALAIALGDSTRVLLITLDICHISRAVVDAVRACLPADLRAPGALRMVASHTHSGPCCANQPFKRSKFSSPIMVRLHALSTMAAPISLSTTKLK